MSEKNGDRSGLVWSGCKCGRESNIPIEDECPVCGRNVHSYVDSGSSGRWWGTFFVGATVGQLTFVLLLIHLMASGCEEYKADKDWHTIAKDYAERLAETEEEQLAMWEVINDMDPNLPSPTPKYEPKCPEPGNVMVKIEGEEEEVSCRDAARMVSGCDFQLEMCCEDLCKAEMKLDPSSAINSSYCGWCGPEDENNGYELEECLDSCKTDKKHYDTTPMQYKECKKKCKNQYGGEE